MESSSSADAQFMERAIVLASQAIGDTSPNPPVGCVLVRDGRIVAEGWHKRAGLAHAEVHALETLEGTAKGCTAYVTLEPCSISGRTGPCTQLLTTAQVARVVVGVLDPNPKVNGNGLAALREAGIQVDSGVLAPQCQRLIDPFAKWVTQGRPWVTLKVAGSLDGRIATGSGHSQWVTGESARARVHQMRDQMDAILVGAQTVRADNPRLTARLPSGPGRHPLRVILSNSLNLAADAHVFDESAPTLVFTSSHHPSAIEKAGIELIRTEAKDEATFIETVLQELGKRDIMSLLLEGGQQVATAFLQAQLVDRISCFVAPKVIGGDGIGWAGALAFRTMDEVISLTSVEICHLGDDLCIEGNCVYGNR
jgi:diaminohydroxyphosphoribosylaminopyrimidine deaminase/5-amino-6-(5-phosphoribosylamino)uracil reductase